MKKIVKIIFGAILVLGCMSAPILDNSGMFVGKAWAAEHTLGGKDESGNYVKVTGNKLKKISCTVLTTSTHEKKDYEISVETDKGQFVATYKGVQAGAGRDCTYHIGNIKNNLEKAGFDVTGITCKDAVCSSSGGNSGSSGGNSGGSSSGGAPEMNVLPCGDEEGQEAIVCVLKLVVNIMTFGIGILGTIGVVISGIQYISSQGDPGKMAKAKNRIIQIVIGLVIYAVLYAGLYFLVPGFNDQGLLGREEQPSTIQVADRPNLIRS